MSGIMITFAGFGLVCLMLALQAENLKFKNKLLEDRIKCIEKSVFKLITMDFDEER